MWVKFSIISGNFLRLEILCSVTVNIMLLSATLFLQILEMNMVIGNC